MKKLLITALLLISTLLVVSCTPIDKLIWRTMKDGTKVLRVVNPTWYHGKGNVECEPAPDIDGNVKCWDRKTGKET